MPSAVIVGWSLEDSQTSPAETLRAYQLPDGTRVLLFASYGAWRADARSRALSRRDLVELFGQQPELALRAVPLDQQGNGFLAASFRLQAATLGTRDIARVRATTAPRETVSVCYISRRVADDLFVRSLRTVEKIADEVVVCVNGTDPPAQSTRQAVDDLLVRFTRETGIPSRVVEGTSPRFCHDCGVEHAVGEMAYGHRFAGFETPRNESLAAARGDWILWLDTDESFEGPDSLHKYLRPNGFAGYSIPQHHHSLDPPGAAKIDFPVRLFRRKADGTHPGWVHVGEHQWPTYHPGLTVRFAGIVHEHPGFAPTYSEGVGPVVILSDVWIAHVGYYTEQGRRARFIRNWPLMAADRQKLPGRRLGEFLWLRDLSHHLRYTLERTQNQITPEAVQLAQECLRIWKAHFVTHADAFSGDAHQYVSVAMQVLQVGMEMRLQAEFWKPEISGDEKQVVQLAGRVESYEQAVQLLEARRQETARWMGRYL